MKITLIILFLTVLFVGSYYFFTKLFYHPAENKNFYNKHLSKSMTITSPAFKNNESIPLKYSCEGEGVSPALTFENVPENTRSLALIVEDPDAPMGLWT